MVNISKSPISLVAPSRLFCNDGPGRRGWPRLPCNIKFSIATAKAIAASRAIFRSLVERSHSQWCEVYSRALVVL